ncbi:MAG: hypothetical protein JXB26_19020 [Candidatus Aminicenantes bacterium]|nr:hypothetical protein [Candidatus Aminicenantes bacterium]
MKSFFDSIFTTNLPPPDSKEGLPFWIFWFLLSIILLLVIFIFLRDKDLRQRLDSFFFKTKQRLIKLQYQARLKREKQKKDELLIEIGKKTFSEQITLDQNKKILEKLRGLEEKQESIKRQSEDIAVKIDIGQDKMTELSKKHEEKLNELGKDQNPHIIQFNELKNKEKALRKDVRHKQKDMTDFEKNIHSLQKEMETTEQSDRLSLDEKKSKIEELNGNINELEEKISSIHNDIPLIEKEQNNINTEIESIEKTISTFDRKISDTKKKEKLRQRKMQKSIKELEKQYENFTEKTKEIEAQKDPLLRRLGEVMIKERPNNNALNLYFSRIDRAEKRIRNLERQIDDL